MDALGGLRRCALVALFAVLVMCLGATGAYAGGRDHGNVTGQQKSSSDENVSNNSSSDDESVSSDSNAKNTNQNGTDCKKNQGETSGQSQSNGPPPPVLGGQEGQKGETGGESQTGSKGGQENGKGGEENGKGGEEHNKGGKENKSGNETPTPVTPTTPTTVPTQTQAQAPVTTPAATPVQTQTTPSQGGQVKAETQETTPAAGKGGKQGSTGGRVLAENTTPVASKSQSSGLASTGFDAWLVALLGVGCIAGAGLLLRRTRRT